MSLGDERYTMRANYARFTLDLDLTYQFSQRFGIYVNGANVTNSPRAAYINNPNALYDSTTFGSTWQIGFKGTF